MNRWEISILGVFAQIGKILVTGNNINNSLFMAPHLIRARVPKKVRHQTK